MTSNNNSGEKVIYDMAPLTKGIFTFVSAILTALTIATFTQVNSSNIEIVKVQTKLSSLEEKITNNKDVTEERLRELTQRTNQLESRINALEKK